MRIPERPPTLAKDFAYGILLDKLVRKGKLTAFFEKNDHAYPYWEKWKWTARDWEIDPKELWFGVKTHRQSKTIIRFAEHPGFQFFMNAPSVLLKHLHELDLNLGGSLQAENLIPAEQKHMYLVGSLMEEAIASSQLEGAATTRKKAREMLENSRKPRDQGEQMIVNNYEAMRWIVEHRAEKCTIDKILHIHKILTKDTLYNPQEEGSLRRDDGVNVVDASSGKVIYTPPPHVHLEELMNTFCDFLNDQDKGVFFIHPISKAIVVHFLIGYIHPFVDGNGRTARTLFYWYLLKKNYWLIEYMSVSRIILNSKAQYAQAYLHTELDQNDLTYFLLYNVQAIQKALGELKAYIQHKNNQRKNALSLLKNSEFNERQLIIINEMLQDPLVSFTVLQLQNKMSVSNQTARSDLNQLETRGFLQSRKVGKQLRFFTVDGFEKKIIGQK